MIGGLVLLKILFTQTRQSLGNATAPVQLPYVTGLMPFYPPPAPTEPATPQEIETSEKPACASRPSYGQTSLKFEDKSAVKVLDYLKASPANVTQAIHNTRTTRLQNRKKPGFREFSKVSSH